MNQRDKAIRKTITMVLLALAVVCTGLSIYIDIYYAAKMPSSPQPELGRIFAITVNHGFVRYVTKSELKWANFVFDKLFWIGLGAFGLFMVLKLNIKNISQ